MNENVLIVAGEPSGDNLAGPLVEKIRTKMPDIDFWGFGGQKMRTAGVETLCDVRELAIMGFAEVIRHLPAMLGRLKLLENEALRRKPRGAILVDYPGFNIRLAERIARHGIPVVYFVSPQIWAWKFERIKKIKRSVAKMLVILPFEEAIYREASVPVSFVGHPFVDSVAPDVEPLEFRMKLGIDGKFLLLLPGSRTQEVSRLLTPMVKAHEILAEKIPGLKSVVARSTNVPIEIYAPATARRDIIIADDIIPTAMFSADAAISCSGSATLQCTCASLPHVITYKTNCISGMVYRNVIRTKFVGLTNLVAGREIAPELLQNNATPENLANAVYPLLADEIANSRMRGDLSAVRASLGKGGVIERAASEVMRTIL